MLTALTGMIHHTEAAEITAHVNVAQDTDVYLGPKKHTALNRCKDKLCFLLCGQIVIPYVTSVAF